MQQVRIVKKIIVFTLLPITNDCFAQLYQWQSIREDTFYYNGLALTELPSIYILCYKTKIQIEEGIVSTRKALRPYDIKHIVQETDIFYAPLKTVLEQESPDIVNCCCELKYSS